MKKNCCQWAVFISGFGSNLQAILSLPSPPAQVKCVVSSHSKAFGIQRAKSQNIPTYILNKSPIQWEGLQDYLKERDVDFLFLAGFMRILPPSFLASWKDRVLNIHPSLLPAYPGKDSLKRSYEAGAALGVTLHKVIAQVDAGPILLQEKVLDANPSGHSLPFKEVEEKIHACEHRLVQKMVMKWSQELLTRS